MSWLAGGVLTRVHSAHRANHERCCQGSCCGAQPPSTPPSTSPRTLITRSSLSTSGSSPVALFAHPVLISPPAASCADCNMANPPPIGKSNCGFSRAPLPHAVVSRRIGIAAPRRLGITNADLSISHPQSSMAAPAFSRSAMLRKTSPSSNTRPSSAGPSCVPRRRAAATW